jgi:hypothetical protein
MVVSKSALSWAKRLDRFDRADVTVAQFCRQEGVSQAAFYYWRRKLRGPLAASPLSQATPLPRFLPVSLTTTPTTSASPAAATPTRPALPSRVTIDLPGGIRIRFELPAGHPQVDPMEVRP